MDSIQILTYCLLGGVFTFFCCCAVFLLRELPRLRPTSNEATGLMRMVAGLVYLFIALNNFCWIVVGVVMNIQLFAGTGEEQMLLFIDTLQLPAMLILGHVLIYGKVPNSSMLWFVMWPAFLGMFVKFLFLDQDVATWTYLVMLGWACIVFFIQYRGLQRREVAMLDQYAELKGRDVKWFVQTLGPLLMLVVIYGIFRVFAPRFAAIVYYLLYVGIFSYLLNRIVYQDFCMDDIEEPERSVTEEIIDTVKEVVGEKTPEKEKIQQPVNDERQQAVVADFALQLKAVCEDKRLFTNEELTRDDLARAIGVNRSYFTTYLKAVTGLSFYEYINKLRLEYAEELLRNPSQPLDTIYLECGYKYKSTYYRAFNAKFGCSPSEYRKNIENA